MYTREIQEPAPENTNHPRSHSRAIMALDYSRLRLENKFLHGRQIRPNFLRSTSLLYKILPTNLGVCKPTFYILFIHHIWGERVYYEALYLSYRPWTECSISQFFKTNCTQSIFRTINRGLLAKPFKKFPKSPIRPAGSHFWQAPNLQCELCRVFEWTLIELRFNIIKNIIYYVYSFI